MATVLVDYVAASGRQYVTLTSWAGTLSFSVTPTAGDQLEGSSALTLNADGTYSGPAGTYTFHLLSQTGTVYTAAATIQAADTTPPTLVNAIGSGVSDTEITAQVTTDELGGTLYAYVSQNTSESAATIKASGDSRTVDALSESFNFTGLTEGESYYVHFVHTDAASNDSNVIRTPLISTVVTQSGATTSVAFVPPNGDSYVTLETGFDDYIFQEWPAGEPAVGWQIVFDPDEYQIDSLANLTTDNEGTFAVWAVDLNGIWYYQAVDTTGLNSTAGAQITSVDVPANGTYGNSPGETLTFTVNYPLNITVTGTPRIPITIGGTTKYADYVSGSGTGALVFEYDVETGLQDLDGISISDIDLNGGTLIDSNDDIAGTTLNSVGSLAAVLVDSADPVGTVDAATTSSTQPAITGTVDDPNATIVVSPGSVSATNNGDGTWTLEAGQITALSAGLNSITAVFTDQAGNSTTASNIIEVSATSVVVVANDLVTLDTTPTVTGTVSLTNSVVKVTAVGLTYDAVVSGTNWSATITAPLPLGVTTISVTATASNGTTDTDTADITITDTDSPTIVQVTPPAPGVYVVGGVLQYSVVFSEPVVVTGLPQIAAPIGVNTRAFAYDSGSGTDTLVFKYTVVQGDNDHDGFSVNAVQLSGGTIRDDAGNDAVLTFSAVATSGVVIDTDPAVISIDSQTTINSAPIITGTNNEPSAQLTLRVGGTTYNPATEANGTWSQQIGSLQVGQYGMTLDAVDIAGNVSTQASATLNIEIPEEVSDPIEPDRLSNAITLLKRRLGRYTDNPNQLDDFILDELVAAQNRLENKTMLPWFLKTRVENIQTTPGQDRIVLPYNWLRLREDWERPVQLLYQGQWRRIGVYSYDQLWDNTSSVPDVPTSCAQDGRHIVLGPPPKEVYQIKLAYYKREFTLVEGKVVSNAWLKYAFDLLVSEAGFILANNYLKSQEATAQFAAEVKRAEEDLRMTNIAYEVAAMESWELNNGR